MKIGFNNVATKDNVRDMWSSELFRKDIEQLNTILGDNNERLQLKVSQAMFHYNTWSETSGMMSKRINQTLKNIAKEINK